VGTLGVLLALYAAVFRVQVKPSTIEEWEKKYGVFADGESGGGVAYYLDGLFDIAKVASPQVCPGDASLAGWTVSVACILGLLFALRYRVWAWIALTSVVGVAT